MDDRYALLSPYLTDARKQRFADVLAQRTKWVTAVTEDLFDPHNISAVLRSCDGFGIQGAHIIEVNNPYRVSPGVAKGAAKWLDIERHTDTTHALRDLKSRGLPSVAPRHTLTTPRPRSFLSTGRSPWSSGRKDRASRKPRKRRPITSSASPCTASRRASTSRWPQP